MNDTPIVGRMIDALDYYKFTMAYFARHYFRDAHVKYAFTNRTKGIYLPRQIDVGRLNEELEHVRQMGFTPNEVNLLRGRTEFKDRFPDWFFDFLLDVELSPLDVRVHGDRLHVETEGNWAESSIWWETIVLTIISELYWESVTKELGLSEDEALARGRKHLKGDVRLLLRNAPGAQISLFGARRRHSNAMEDQAHEVFMDLAPQMLFGTSTVGKGITYDLRITGTNAHELPMVLFSLLWAKMGDGADLGEVARISQLDMLDKWWDLYGYDLSIGLTDTYGTNFFLDQFGEERARAWKGFRQDSGDPLTIGYQYLNYYNSMDIDAREKSVLFTDGLVQPTIAMLWQEFHEKFQVGFGWGTGATSNVFPNSEYYRHASLVMKAVAANEMPNAKITDNPMKAAGDPHVAERLKAAIGHIDGPAITPVF